MSKQYNKSEKRSRRLAYIKRKKTASKVKKSPPPAAAPAAPAVPVAVEPAPSPA